MNFLKNGNKVHRYMKTILQRHSISKSIEAPITRPHFQNTKSSYMTRVPQAKVKDGEVSIPLASISRFSWSSNSRMIGWYLDMLKTRPILTTSISTALIYGAGDLSSQIITGSSLETYDTMRTFRMVSYGLILAGPSLYFWFTFVSRVFPKRDFISTCKKIFTGQIMYAPIMAAVFFSFNAVLQGETGLEIVARLKRDMIPALTNSFVYWVICDFIIYKFIPVPLQPLVCNSFAYIWTIYMTYMASLIKASHQETDNVPS